MHDSKLPCCWVEPDNLLVSDSHRTGGNRQRHEQPDTKGERTKQIDQKEHKSEQQKCKPVVRYNFAAYLHCLPELHAVINNEKCRKHIADSEINSWKQKENKADGNNNRAGKRGKEQWKKIVESPEKIVELNWLLQHEFEGHNAVASIKRCRNRWKQQGAAGIHHWRCKPDGKERQGKTKKCAKIFAEHPPRMLDVLLDIKGCCGTDRSLEQMRINFFPKIKCCHVYISASFGYGLTGTRYTTRVEETNEWLQTMWWRGVVEATICLKHDSQDEMMERIFLLHHWIRALDNSDKNSIITASVTFGWAGNATFASIFSTGYVSFGQKTDQVMRR